MSIRVEQLRSDDTLAWDEYVRNHPRGTAYHLAGWQNVIEKTYGHRTYYLMAIEDKPELMAHKDSKKKIYDLLATSYELNSYSVVGILPLVHINHFIFGNSLISMPFLDYGGILADDQVAEKALLLHAAKLSEELGVSCIELRQIGPLQWINEIEASYQLACLTKIHKTRMLLELPESSEELIRSFKSKLRSQIKKPLKEGLRGKVGGLELLDDFYWVFSTNMRDLGSPVHSKKLMTNILFEFPEESRIILVNKGDRPFAASMIIAFKDMLENPWSSALRKYRKMSPNMLLYWVMLEYACNNGFKYFDFGRSSIAEGTYKFKEQWGAKPITLNWHYISLNGKPIATQTSEKNKFQIAIKFWQRLPVPVTKIIGPRIRKYIGL